MKLRHITMLSLVVLSPAAFAADGTITFTGTITTNTCKIDGAESVGVANKSVNLGDVPASALATEGEVAGNQAFSLVLTDCSVGSNASVAARFESLTLGTTDGYLALDATSTAENVRIGIYDTSGTIQPVNGIVPTSSYVTLGEDGDATLNYVAAYNSTGTPVAGSANSQVSYTLSYQ